MNSLCKPTYYKICEHEIQLQIQNGIKEIVITLKK